MVDGSLKIGASHRKWRKMDELKGTMEAIELTGFVPTFRGSSRRASLFCGLKRGGQDSCQ